MKSRLNYIKNDKRGGVCTGGSAFYFLNLGIDGEDRGKGRTITKRDKKFLLYIMSYINQTGILFICSKN
jgi:hypothetical protein